MMFMTVVAAGQSLSVERGTGALVRTAGGASASITVHGRILRLSLQ